MAVLLVHHTAPSWSKIALLNLRKKMGLITPAEFVTQIANERSYDKATLCLVKGEYAQGDLVEKDGAQFYQSHYVFTGAERKPSVILKLDRVLPSIENVEPDITITANTSVQFQEPENTSQPTHIADSTEPTLITTTVAEEEDLSDNDLLLFEQQVLDRTLGDGEISAVAIEYCVKQIAFGGKDAIQ